MTFNDEEKDMIRCRIRPGFDSMGFDRTFDMCPRSGDFINIAYTSGKQVTFEVISVLMIPCGTRSCTRNDDGTTRCGPRPPSVNLFVKEVAGISV